MYGMNRVIRKQARECHKCKFPLIHVVPLFGKNRYFIPGMIRARPIWGQREGGKDLVFILTLQGYPYCTTLAHLHILNSLLGTSIQWQVLITTCTSKISPSYTRGKPRSDPLSFYASCRLLTCSLIKLLLIGDSGQ